MPYIQNRLISRSGYSGTPGLGDVWDSITGAASSVLKFYGAEQQAVGAAAASAQQNRDLTAALAARQGISTETVLLVGGAALAIFLIARKRKSAA